MSELTWASRTCFTLLGGREVVTAERMRELIAEAQVTDFDAVTKIVLSNKGITEHAAELLAKEVLDKCNNITVVDIHDVIAGRPEDEALRTLAWICNSLGRTQKLADQIVELNVSDNALGEKGVNACKAVLTGKNLQRLYFCNDGMSAEAATLISQMLLPAPPAEEATPSGSNDANATAAATSSSSSGRTAAPPLTTLHFFNNMSGSGGGHAIARIVRECSATLTDLRFSATRCMKDGCKSIVEALHCLGENQLVRLDLQDNNFGSAGSSAATSNEMVLARAIARQSQSLQHLNLRDANLGDAAVCALLQGGLARIQSLDLSGNELTSSCAVRLAGLLGGCKGTLETLLLDENDELIGCPDDDEDEDEDEDDDEEGGEGGDTALTKGYLGRARALCGAWEDPSAALTSLSLANCNLTSGSAIIVYSSLARLEMQRRRGGQAGTAGGVKLNLNGNRLSAACINVGMQGLGSGMLPIRPHRSDAEVEGLVAVGSLEDNDEVEDAGDDDEEGESEDDLLEGMLFAQAMAVAAVDVDVMAAAMIADASTGKGGEGDGEADELTRAMGDVSI